MKFGASEIIALVVLLIKSSRGEDACNNIVSGLQYLNAVDNGAVVLKVPSTTDGIGLCCSACSSNISCASWTLNWNVYKREPAPFMSTCMLFPEVPPSWATFNSHPPFECREGVFPSTQCANFTYRYNDQSVSGHKNVTNPRPPPNPLPGPNPPSSGKLPNILYLVADDMRQQLNTYGHGYMKTPHLDKLASQGVQFDFAYTQFAYCAPSRNSFMSGRRPDRTLALNFLTTFRERPGGENWTAMPQFFKNQGWFTSSAGKIYHDGMDDDQSWTFPSHNTAWIGCQPGDTADGKPLPGNQTDFNSMFYDYCTVTENSTVKLTNENISIELGLFRMKMAVASSKPWWVSIGVHRPHAPYRGGPGFDARDLYPNVSLPLFPHPPANSPYMAGNWIGNDQHDAGVGSPNTTISPDGTRSRRQYYYAAVTWTDFMLGQALAELESYGANVSGNTITVFHADHGYQLGELNEWSKKTNTELATRVPLIIRVPWLQSSAGKRTKVYAELVDIYRTLADLAGLLNKVEDSVQGMSLKDALVSPESLPPTLRNKTAFSQIARCLCGQYTCRNPIKDTTHCKPLNQSWYPGKQGCFPYEGSPNTSLCTDKGRDGCVMGCGWSGYECGGNACSSVPQNEFDYMGYSMRVNTWRFTAWVSWDKSKNLSNWNNDIQYELYDLSGDNGQDYDYSGYSRNLAYDSPQHKAIVSELREQLYNEWKTWPL
eukprot:m.160533 g.160533  ORF g.160533 m.160533 type:complete len:713 (+) comp15169_c0_seq2:37-2175(+)